MVRGDGQGSGDGGSVPGLVDSTQHVHAGENGVWPLLVKGCAGGFSASALRSSLRAVAGAVLP